MSLLSGLKNVRGVSPPGPVLSGGLRMRGVPRLTNFRVFGTSKAVGYDLGGFGSVLSGNVVRSTRRRSEGLIGMLRSRSVL